MIRRSVKIHQQSRIREEISARMPLTDDGAPLDVTQLIRRAEVMRPDYTMPIEE